MLAQLELLVVTTGFNLAEESMSHGRLLLYAVVPSETMADDAEAVETLLGPATGAPASAAPAWAPAAAEPGAPTPGRCRLVRVCAHALRGQVTCAACLEGMLLVAAGTKLVLYELRHARSGGTGNKGVVGSSPLPGMSLEPVGVVDAGFMSSSMSVIKSYALVGDAAGATALFTWRARARLLERIARDPGNAGATAVAFMVEGAQLVCTVCDERGGVRLLAVSRQHGQGRSGPGPEFFVTRAAFQAGAAAAAAVSVPMHGAAADAEVRVGAIVGLANGAVMALCPSDPALFRRLAIVHQRMVQMVPHTGGFNPRAFRARNAGATHAAQLNGIADGAMIGCFHSLAHRAQERIARQVGTRRADVVASFAETLEAVRGLLGAPGPSAR